MNDSFEQVWREKLCRLPPAEPLTLKPMLNTEAEHLSCVFCGRGHEETSEPPEWLVTFRTSHETVTRGLHEACRRRNAKRSAKDAPLKG